MVDIRDVIVSSLSPRYLSHFHHEVREYLDAKIPYRWTGCASWDESLLRGLQGYLIYGVMPKIVRPAFATWISTAAREDHACNRGFRLSDVETCMVGTGLQDWCLPHHQWWTYGTPVRYLQNLDRYSIHWYMRFRYISHGYRILRTIRRTLIFKKFK